MGFAEFFKSFFGGKKAEVVEATHHVPTVAETVVAGSEAVEVCVEESSKDGVE